jgi:hypothetical protein
MRSGIQFCTHRRVRLFLQDVEVSVHIWFLELRKGTTIHVMSLILQCTIHPKQKSEFRTKRNQYSQ